MTNQQVIEKMELVRTKIIEVQNDPDLDEEFKTELITGYRQMINKGKAWIRGHQRRNNIK